MIPIIGLAIGSRRASSTATRLAGARDSATGLPARRQRPRPAPPRAEALPVLARPPVVTRRHAYFEKTFFRSSWTDFRAHERLRPT